MIYRQGNILIKKIENLPKNIKLRNSTIILYGEATKHKHQLISGSVFDGENGTIFIKVLNKTQIVHEEHKPVNLPKGFYSVIRQREYLTKDMVRLVVD